jgi:hypothetical protein
VSGVVANRSSAEGQAVLARYREALFALTVEVLTQAQFRQHQARLEQLDDEELDDNVSCSKILRSKSAVKFRGKSCS